MTMSRGSGISSLNSTAMIRSFTSRSALPSTPPGSAATGNTHRKRSSRRWRMPRSTRRSSTRSRIQLACWGRVLDPVAGVVPLGCLRDAGEGRIEQVVPDGGGIDQDELSRSVSIRFSSARSISTAPARAHYSDHSGTRANSPPSSSRISSMISSANLSTGLAPCRIALRPARDPAPDRGRGRAPDGTLPTRAIGAVPAQRERPRRTATDHARPVGSLGRGSGAREIGAHLHCPGVDADGDSMDLGRANGLP